MATYEWESVTLGQNPEIQKIVSAAAKASELLNTNVKLAKTGLGFIILGIVLYILRELLIGIISIILYLVLVDCSRPPNAPIWTFTIPKKERIFAYQANFLAWINV